VVFLETFEQSLKGSQEEKHSGRNCRIVERCCPSTLDGLAYALD